MTPNWLDRVIGVVAPRAALRRVASRHALDIAVRDYAGADRGRLTDGWRSRGSSADAEISIAGPVLRDRSRELTRNNPHAAKALSSWVNNVVGDGIMPRPVTGDPAKDKKIKELFDRFTKYCDADGGLDFYGQQQLACREMIEGGEVLLRRRRRFQSDGLEVPLQVQVLEADMLDHSRQGDMGNGNLAVQGIEFDAIGRRVNYWLFAQHPGNNVISLGARIASAPVPASEISHVFERQRTQIRGVPWCTPAMRTLKDIEEWDQAEGIRKKTESCVVGIVTGFEEDQMSISNPSIETATGRKIEKFEPGLIAYARGGKTISFNSPASVGGYGEYKQSRLRDVAAGYRIPYELLTGDLSQINFSSIRAGLVEYRRLVKAVQWQIFIPGYCQPIWDWFCETAFFAGLVDTPTVAVEWAAPKFEWVDPYKDVLADILAIRAGIRTWHEVVTERGRNIADVIAEIKEFNDTVDKDAIILDIDPRYVVGKTGSLQNPAFDPNNPEPAVAPAPALGNGKPIRGGEDQDASILERALAYRLIQDDGGREFSRALPELIEALRSQRPPIIKTPVSVTVPPAQPKRAERTVVTKHDERGRIVEFERREID